MFLQTIDAVYASGLDVARVPQALEATSRLLGASGAILEVIDKSAQRPVEFYSAGLPDVARVPYIEQFAALNPRIPFALRQPAGAIIWDHQILSEVQMARDPFYAEFLPHMDLRYFTAAIFEHTPEKLAAVHVQRTRKQGHVDKREITLMRRLCPHYQRAYDMARRLKTCTERSKYLKMRLNGWTTASHCFARTAASYTLTLPCVPSRNPGTAFALPAGFLSSRSLPRANISMPQLARLDALATPLLILAQPISPSRAAAGCRH